MKPKILFIAIAQSTHTHSWIELLKDSGMDVKVFGVSYVGLPASFSTPAFSTCSNQLDLPHVSSKAAIVKFRKVISNFFQRSARRNFCHKEEDWLAEIIRNWQPDIIHSLGLDPASYLYCRVREEKSLQQIGTWVVTARGGPELALQRLVLKSADNIRNILISCDKFIADNKQNYEYAIKLGLTADKISGIGIAPGTGGVDVDALASLSDGLPSKRQRLIVWPKAYECPASKALPVFDALRLCWDQIKPCKIIMTAMIPETRMWFQTLPREIRDSCQTRDRITRDELLILMGKARVLLVPSLTDGIPNSLYEAMATGAFPIVSPLETIKEAVSERKNVYFARNLYPCELADAINRSMKDDDIVDNAARENLVLVRKIAERRNIASKVKNFYLNLSSRSQDFLDTVR